MKRRALCAALLTVVAASLWCVTSGRTSLEAWRVPIDYSADALYTLGTLRAAQEGHVTPVGPPPLPAREAAALQRRLGKSSSRRMTSRA